MKIACIGSYYDQGFSHGRAAKKLIGENLALIHQILSEKKSDLELYTSFVSKHFKNVFNLEPYLEEELRGIADGSGYSFWDIMMLNANFYFFADKIVAAPEECSVIIAGPQATLDRKTYFIKNRDMLYPFQTVILERRFEDGVRISEVDLAGIVTFPGSAFNHYGLGVSTTGVWSPNIPLDFGLIGNLPYSFSPHTFVRNFKTVDEVLAFLEGKYPYKISHSNLFLIDPTKAVRVETTDKGFRVCEWKNDLLVGTNHFHHPDFLPYNPDRAHYQSTYQRYDRAMEMLEENYGRLRFQDMLEIASDHMHGENCLCRHGENGGGITICSTITCLEDQKSWTAVRNPCEALIPSHIDCLKKESQ